MAEHLQFDTSNHAELEEYAHRFVDRKLHHHVYTEDDLINHPAMRAVPLCLRVYKLLLSVAQDNIAFTDAAFIDEWQRICTAFAKVAPLYQFVSAVSTENRELERTIRVIHKSIPWRLLSPLVWVDKFLRQRRRKLRREQRWKKVWTQV